MNESELKALRHFAAQFRNRGGFPGIFVKCDGNTGDWKGGKNATDMKGRQVIADTHDAMHGLQTFEDKKPTYCIGRIADGWQLPAEAKFDEAWKPVVLLPMYDFETHELLLFTSQNKGGRDAIGNLVDAMFDTYDAHPADVGKLPICELASDSYLNTHGKRIHFPIFEIVGWTERPAEVHRVKPPLIDVLAIENKSKRAESTPSPKPTASAKPPRHADLDDEIPF
jgi:hypothetical protein